MKRSNAPLHRQYSHPPPGTAASILSPTTKAAKAGIKLSDPAVKVFIGEKSTAADAPKTKDDGSSSTTASLRNSSLLMTGDQSNNSSYGIANDSSIMTTRRSELAPVPLALTRTTSIDKENQINSNVLSYNDYKPPPSANEAYRDDDPMVDEQEDFSNSENVSQRNDTQMMDYRESESMMTDMQQGESMIDEIRPPYNDEDQEMSDLDECAPDDSSSDDCSECSGGTVVATDEIEKPPAGLTQEELSKYYWEICYGPDYMPPPTIPKSLPSKSCLSTRKAKSGPTEIASSMTPRKLLDKSPSTELIQKECKDDKTPKNNVTRLAPTTTMNRAQSAVKFGVNVAAEFSSDLPTTEMKHMPPSVVLQIFPNDKVETQKDIENEEVSRETKQNVSILAEWDDDFDSIIDNDNSDEEGSCQLPKRRRKQTPYKQRGRGNTLSRPRKSRRQSSIFGSADRGRSLLDISDEVDEEDLSNGLPLSVTINPEEYTSPPSNTLNDSMSSIELPDTSSKQNDRDSLSSSCISPSSLRSGSIMATRSNRSSSSSSKETPKSARTSSSTILQTVHASGAFLPTNSPQGNELMPNQLKYSPKGGTTGINASPSSTGSIGSDIMSLFTKHSLEDETEGNLLSRQLEILASHPTEVFHNSLSDVAQWVAASGKPPLDFFNDHISKGMNLSTSISLLNEADHGNSSSLFCGTSPDLFNGDCFFLEQCLQFMSRNPQVYTEAIDLCNSRTKVAIDSDETMASYLKMLQDVSSFSWSSSIELTCAQVVLEKFQSKSKEDLQEAQRKFVILEEKIKEASNLITQQNLTTQKLQAKKCVASTKIEEMSEYIQLLENQLSQEIERLEACQRARDIFTAHLNVEKASPISAISEEIRTTIFPSPITHNGSDFSFILLDGMAEVVLNIGLDEESMSNIEIGCFIKNDAAVSSCLLKAMLLGSTELDSSQGHGPFSLRNSLQSVILPSLHNETTPVRIKDLFADATHAFFLVDNLVRTVKRLESQALCTFNIDQGSGILSVTLKSGNNFIRLEFLFYNLLGHLWTFSTSPDDVVLTIDSASNDLESLALHLQQQARDVLKSKHRDPVLLHRICEQILVSFAQACVNK